MSIYARHARRSAAEMRRLKARNRFRTVWADRFRRNIAAFTGGTATVVLAGAIGAMLGTVR